MQMTLDQIGRGNKGIVSEIIESHISSKLLELGFISGSMVEVVFEAPFKDPIAVELNGSMISLRLDEASTILIEKEDKS